MKILLSNDDGLMADGIRALTEALSVENEVYVIAPDRERSAAGHSLTLHTPLRVEELEPKFGAKRNWVTNGTPGDCVKIGLSAILSEEEKPDIVISGINHGPNLGADILYSGTVSCAIEGAMIGYHAMAVSLATMSYNPEDFKIAAEFIAKLLPRLRLHKAPPRTILNINIPALDIEDITGIAVTKLGTRMFTNTYEKRVDPRGKVYYWMAGELVRHDENDGTDINAIRCNKISITPICFSMTTPEIINGLTERFKDEDISTWY